MKLLLDTHAFLWFIEDDPQLMTRTKAAIEDGNNEVYLSIASVWEIAIKSSIGKLQITTPFESFIARQLLHNRIRLLAISLEHSAAVIELPHHHRDPFDRMLIAQVQVERMTFISRDPVIDAYGVTRLW